MYASIRGISAGPRGQELHKQDRGEDTRGNMPTTTINLQGTYNFFFLRSGKRITRGQFTEVPTPTIVMKLVAAMALSKKKDEGIIFLNHAGVMVNNIFPDDDANEAFNKIDRNIAGVDWEAEPPEQEIQDPEVHIPHMNNNQYAALADDEGDDENEDDQENDTKSTGVENDDERIEVRHGNKITGVDSNIESTRIKLELGSTGATD